LPATPAPLQVDGGLQQNMAPHSSLGQTLCYVAAICALHDTRHLPPCYFYFIF
jgi:hypothetical protein